MISSPRKAAGVPIGVRKLMFLGSSRRPIRELQMRSRVYWRTIRERRSSFP
jgi:hypothetical protein